MFADYPRAAYAYQDPTGQRINSVLKYTWTGEFYTQQDLTDISSGKLARPDLGARLGDLKYADLNGDLKINADDRSYFGPTNNPTTTFGFALNVGFKGLNLSVLFQGATDVVSSSAFSNILYTGNNNGSNAQPVHLYSWTPELGNDARHPRLYTTRGINDSRQDFYYSDFWARDASYIRLKTAEVSYSLTGSLVRKLRMREVRIYTNGYNLATWTRKWFDRIYEGIDPERQESSGAVYPVTKTFNAGINITF